MLLPFLILVVRRYGRDFQAMADIVGNKTVQQCRNFFMNHRKKYSLDHVLEEYRAERERRGDDARQAH